jgi:acyl carrier protein
MTDIREYLLEAIQEKSHIAPDVDVDALDYTAEGYVDSLGMVKFVVDIEQKFGIEFTDEELSRPEFRVFGPLVRLVRDKVARNEDG